MVCETAQLYWHNERDQHCWTAMDSKSYQSRWTREGSKYDQSGVNAQGHRASEQTEVSAINPARQTNILILLPDGKVALNAHVLESVHSTLTTARVEILAARRSITLRLLSKRLKRKVSTFKDLSHAI